eukprot:scaffold98973_cov75-Phaeocystis_antarctica.AAC.1
MGLVKVMTAKAACVLAEPWTGFKTYLWPERCKDQSYSAAASRSFIRLTICVSATSPYLVSRVFMCTLSLVRKRSFSRLVRVRAIGLGSGLGVGLGLVAGLGLGLGW